MEVPRLAPVLVALAVASACTGMNTDLAELADDPGAEGEIARFCLSVGRALSAIAEDRTAPAAHEAAEEVLALAPEGLKQPARAVVDHLPRAGDGAGVRTTTGLDDAADALRDGAQRICEPLEAPGR